MQLHLGVGLDWIEVSYDDWITFVNECEMLGYEYLWFANEKFYHDMYIMAAAAAVRTTHSRLGTFVADPYSLHPALTAVAIGTLDEVSHGRAILCIGAGGTGFPALGIKRIKPAQAIKEAILLIRSLLKGEIVDYQGEVITFHQGRLNFEPRSNIPIFVASRGERVLQVAGEYADGVMIATFAEPQGIRYALANVELGAKRAKRDLSSLTIISRVDTCISRDRQTAVQSLKPMVATALWTSYPDRHFVRRLGLELPAELEKVIATRDYDLLRSHADQIPDEFIKKFCWAGTAEDVAQSVLSVCRIGITDIAILPHSPPGHDRFETAREFARTVKPLVEEKLAVPH